MINMMLIFFGVSLVNVVLNTAKSLFTVKGGIVSATVINALTFGFYTYVIVLTANTDFSTNIKAILTVIANIIGVALVKFIELKMRKDKVWVFNATCNKDFATVDNVVKALKELKIKLVYNELVKDSLYTMNIYSNSQKESELIETVLKTYELKYCAYATELVGE